MTEQKKNRKWLRIVIAVLAVLLVLAGSGALLVNHYYSKLNVVEVKPVQTQLSDENQSSAAEEIVPTETMDPEEALRLSYADKIDRDFSGKNVKNILLIGTDITNTQSDEWGNADGIILASINADTRQIVLTSFMRDTAVRVQDRYTTKLTSSYHDGGTALLVQTMEENFGIPIDNYVLFDYTSIVKIVDSVGGIVLPVSEGEIYYMADKINSINSMTGQEPGTNILTEDQAGNILLNGTQVAAYLRVRMASSEGGNNDMGRTYRARLAVMALAEKAKTMKFSELNDLFVCGLGCITTDLGQGELYSILFNALDYLRYDILSSRVPVDGSYESQNLGGSFVVPDFEVNNAYLYDTIYNGSLSPAD